jgi:hypothetical protein
LEALAEIAERIGSRARSDAAQRGARIATFMLGLAPCYDFWLVGA